MNSILDEFESIKGRPQRRVLVYCMTRAEVQAAYQVLHDGLRGTAWVAACTGETSAEDKQAVVTAFAGDTDLPGVVVGTSAFGAGVDSPEVVLVVHVGGAWGFSQLLQEAGRAGRDGKITAQHVVWTDKRHLQLIERQAQGVAPPPTDCNPRPARPDARQQRHAKMLLDYLRDTDTCRRVLIDGYLLGGSTHGTLCLHDHDSELCQMCFVAFETALLSHELEDSDISRSSGGGDPMISDPTRTPTTYRFEVKLRLRSAVPEMQCGMALDQSQVYFRLSSCCFNQG